MSYLTYTPWWLRKLYPACVWQIPTKEKVVYLTFDDGPNPLATPFVLEQLAKFNAKGTFFCIGKNVVQHPEIFAQTKNSGHSVGNHTMHHANGWKTENEKYLDEIKQADAVIHSNLFRPPYGRIKRAQIKAVANYELQITNYDSPISNHEPSTVNCQPSTVNRQPSTVNRQLSTVMWSILSGDFDTNINGEKCFQNVIKHVKPGSIIVFHDSEKAFPRLQIALPKTLEWLTKQGFRCEAVFL